MTYDGCFKNIRVIVNYAVNDRFDNKRTTISKIMFKAHLISYQNVND